MPQHDREHSYEIDAVQKDLIKKQCSLIADNIEELCNSLYEYDIEIDLSDVLTYSLEELKHALSVDMDSRLN